MASQVRVAVSQGAYVKNSDSANTHAWRRSTTAPLLRLPISFSDECPQALLTSLYFGQLFALLWLLGRPWPWPQQLTYYTRWIVWLNLDWAAWLTTTSNGDATSPDRGSLFGYFPAGYVLPFWVVATAWSVAVGTFASLMLSQPRHPRALEHAVGWSTALYLPAAITLSRVYSCEPLPGFVGYRLAVDPAWPCGGPTHLILACCCAPAAVALLLAPLRLWRAVSATALTAGMDEASREQLLCWMSVERRLGISGTGWDRSGAWVSAPFLYRRDAEWAIRGLVAVALVLVLTVLREYPAQQAVLYFVCVAGLALRQLAFPAFRSWLVAALSATFASSLAVVSFLGMARANGVVNQLTVDAGLSASVAAIAAATLAAALLLVSARCLGVVVFLRADDAAPYEGGASDLSVIEELGARGGGARFDVNFLMGTRAALDAMATIPPLLLDMPLLASVRLRVDRRLRQLARSRAPGLAVFDATECRAGAAEEESTAASGATALGDGEPTPLGLMAVCVLELSLAQTAHGLSAVAAAAAPVSLLPHPATPSSRALAAALQDLRPRLDERDTMYALQGRARHRLFVLKLLAASAFMSGSLRRRRLPLPVGFTTVTPCQSVTL